MKVGLLTQAQKDLLVGTEYEPSTYYNPIQDCNNDWVISTQEMEQTTNVDYLWVKSLSLIDYCPPPFTPPPYTLPE